MRKRCKTEGCVRRAISKFDGYCSECYKIHLLREQSKKLDQLLEIYQPAQLVVKSGDNKDVFERQSPSFVPTIDKPESRVVNLQTKRSVSNIRHEEIDDTIEKLKSVTHSEKEE